MRLDPVFLVAPKPTPPTMPTRRAFLVAGATFSLGAVFGGACGYSIGAASAATKSADTPQPDVDPDLAPTGDADLDELRRLAVKAPIEELVEKRLVFISCLFGDYPKDHVMWKGAGRLCDAVLGTHNVPDRRVFARALAQVIERGDPTLVAPLFPRVAELRRVE